MMSPPNPARDLRFSGQVIYTGRSSMEVAVKMESIGMEKPEDRQAPNPDRSRQLSRVDSHRSILDGM